MSFVRVGRSQQQPKGRRPARPKKEWVSTNTDLSVHKLTPAELSHRREIHKSQNKAVAHLELREKALRRCLRQPGIPAFLNQANLSISREVFSEQLLLQDVLDRSDRALAVVKDLFGDAPRRQTGHPNVTMAPNCDTDTVLPVLQKPDPPTQLSLLSKSMMDQQALNELNASEEDFSDAEISPAGCSDSRVIKRTTVRKMRKQQKGNSCNSVQIGRDEVPLTPCSSGRPTERALNATVAVRAFRSRRRLSEKDQEEPDQSVLFSQVLNPELPLNQSGVNRSRRNRARKGVSSRIELSGDSVASLSGNQSSLDLLQAMLDQVVEDLDTLSPNQESAAAQSHNWSQSKTLTGFSVSLVSTLGRLINLLKQSKEESQKNAQDRRKLEEQLKDQRRLIDALTAETMTLREESASMQRWRADMEQKFDSVVLVMGELGLLEAHIDLMDNVKSAGLQSAPGAKQPCEPFQPSVSPAVMIAPPCQKDNRRQSPVTHPIRQHQESPPLLLPHSREDGPTKSSASSFSSHSSTSLLKLPSDTPISQFLPEPMLADIALLSKQNSKLKAQLKSLGSEVRGSPDSSTAQPRLSSSSTEEVIPEGFEQRRIYVPSRTGGRKQQSERDLLITKETSPNSLCVSSVEQQLLELNRQSAAARVRLLELIEQQRRTVSPSASSVPPSAFSPHLTGMVAQSDASLCL